MAAPTNITDALSGFAAKVTRFGQLIVAPLDYSKPVEHDLDAINTAFNFVTPSQDQNIVITDIVVSADKDVSANTPAIISIFEADAVDSIVPNALIIKPQLLRSENFAISGLNLLISEGKWINATTTDTTIILTIMFYRVPVKEFA